MKRIYDANNKLGFVLREARLDARLTLRDVEIVSKGGISNAYLSQVEIGNKIPSAKKLRVLADLLKLNLVELMIVAGHLTKKDLNS